MEDRKLLDGILEDIDDIGAIETGRYSSYEIKERLKKAYESGLLSRRAETFKKIQSKIISVIEEYCKSIWTLEEATYKLKNLYNGLACSAIEKI